MGRKNSIILPKTSLDSSEATYKQALFEEMRARQFAFCPYLCIFFNKINERCQISNGPEFTE